MVVEIYDTIFLFRLNSTIEFCFSYNKLVQFAIAYPYDSEIAILV